MTWAFDVYSPSPPTRSAITAKASGTLGSGTWLQPVGIGSTMLSALKSLADCGSRPTFLLFRKSVMVPEAAGTIVGGAATATGAVATFMPAAGWTPAASAAAAGWPNAPWMGADAGAAGGTVPAWTVIVCVMVAGAGSAGCGSVGSAEAVVPARPTTQATPAAKPPIRRPQRRAFTNM